MATAGAAAARFPPRNGRKRCGCARKLSELKERIKVLERITVEKENTLARQIEELRDR